MKSNIITLLLIHLTIFGFAQSNLSSQLDYEVNTVYPSHSISKENLKQATSLVDLNEHYKPSWVREYISVAFFAMHDGDQKQVVGKNEFISQEQKDFILSADAGKEISVLIKYIPENNLKNNPPKELDFKLFLEPDNEAKYVKGLPQMKQYLKENAIDKISIPDFLKSPYNMVAVKFTVDEKGEIMDTHLFNSSSDDKVDELLVNVVSNMPAWKPATYSNGTKVKQEFVLTVGSHDNCNISLLNIRRD